MKKYAILLVVLGVMGIGGLYLSLTGCKMPHLKYVGDFSQENGPDVAADIVYGYKLIHVGELFPDITLKAPENLRDRFYLGLKSDAVFSIRDIQADMVLVVMLNTHCVPCRKQAAVYNNLFKRIEADDAARGRIKMLAVGAGNNEEEIINFREKYDVRFPVVADQGLDLHEAVGKPRLPFSVLVRRVKKPDTAMVALTYSDINEESDNIYQDMMVLQDMNLEAFRARGLQAEAKVETVAPPLPPSVITEKVKSAMGKVGAGNGHVSEFQKLSFKGHLVYTGLIGGKKDISRLFAEVISSPTICRSCEDVHFFYIFNDDGVVLDFVPLQLTKWGNEQWSEQDVKLMHDRLAGRFIFTPFYFNPQLDAVTSATITSVVIFNNLSDGKKLFDLLQQKGLISKSGKSGL